MTRYYKAVGNATRESALTRNLCGCIVLPVKGANPLALCGHLRLFTAVAILMLVSHAAANQISFSNDSRTMKVSRLGMEASTRDSVASPEYESSLTPKKSASRAFHLVHIDYTTQVPQTTGIHRRKSTFGALLKVIILPSCKSRCD